MTTRYNKTGVVLFSLFFFIIILLLLRLLWVFLGALVLALLTVNLTYPLYHRLQYVLKQNKKVAAFMMTSVVILCIIIPLFLVSITISREAHNLYTKTKGIVSNEELSLLMEKDTLIGKALRQISKIVDHELTPEYITNVINDLIKNIAIYLTKEFNTIVSNVAKFVLSFLVMVATIFTIYRRGDELKEYLLELIPIPKNHLEVIVSKFNEIGRSILFINGLSGVIQGSLLGLSFVIVGLGAPVLWGALGGFFAFMPIIGITLVYIPATVILIINGQMLHALFIFFFNLLHSSLVEYILKPRLIGKDIKMSGLLVFMGIIGGMQLFGVLGLFYGPLIISLFISLAELYRLEYRKILENGLKNESE